MIFEFFAVTWRSSPFKAVTGRCFRASQARSSRLRGCCPAFRASENATRPNLQTCSYIWSARPSVISAPGPDTWR